MSTLYLIYRCIVYRKIFAKSKKLGKKHPVYYLPDRSDIELYVSSALEKFSV